MEAYKLIDALDKWKNRTLFVSTIVTLTLNFNERYHFLERYGYGKTVSDIIIGFNAVLVVSYVVSEIISTITFQKAEGNRILRYIDNSFSANFSASAIPQTGYFSQDVLNPGLYKMCVNCFESVLFSSRISKKMEPSRYVKASVVFFAFIFTATIGDSGTVRYLTDAILPLSLVQDAVRFYHYSSRLDSIFSNFASFFTSLDGSSVDFSKRHSEALKLVITYETTLAWSSINLDSKIYNDLNPSLSIEWTLLKQQYKID